MGRGDSKRCQIQGTVAPGFESVRQLLVFFGKKYSIPLSYNENMWDIAVEALSGEKGVWTHASYRSDKSDCHPQPELIEMLKSLNEK